MSRKEPVQEPSLTGHIGGSGNLIKNARRYIKCTIGMENLQGHFEHKEWMDQQEMVVYRKEVY